MTTPFTPATVRIELVYGVLPSNNLVLEPDPDGSELM